MGTTDNVRGASADITVGGLSGSLGYGTTLNVNWSGISKGVDYFKAGIGIGAEDLPMITGAGALNVTETFGDKAIPLNAAMQV